MLLFSHEFVKSFGLRTPCDPFQQSGFLYALYSSAAALQGGNSKSSCAGDTEKGRGVTSALQWHSQGNIQWHFREETCSDDPESKGAGNRRILIAMATSCSVSASTAQAISTALSQASIHRNAYVNG